MILTRAVACLCFLTLSLLGCKPFTKDYPPRLDRKSIEVVTSPLTPPKVAKPAPTKKPLPKQKIPKEFLKPVSITLTESFPIKQALIELSRQTNVNLQLDPTVSGSVIFSAYNRPFIEVVSDICELANLRFRVIGRSVRIENDTPYHKTYNVQFLNLSRNIKNNISVATDVFANRNQKVAYTKNDNGSNSSILATAKNDFWTELESNLEMILGSQDDSDGGAKFSLHRQGGIVSIFGREKHHRLIKKYLKMLRRAVSSQVLIEAKVVEVVLHDQYRAGINWTKLSGGLLRFNAPFGDLARAGRFSDPTDAQKTLVSFGLRKGNFSSLINALKEFGSSRILSSPRLTVMNNQTAILKVAKNQVYFQLHYDRHFNLAVNRESINVTSDIHTVPIGLVISVQPSIDLDTGDIILYLRPTITRFSQTVQDPAVDIARTQNTSNANLAVQTQPSLIPIVEVQEFDTVMRLKNGQTGLLGGLMEVRTAQDHSHLPGFKDVRLFESTSDAQEVVELVIAVRAEIAPGTPKMDPADKRLYQGFLSDPRPVEF